MYSGSCPGARPLLEKGVSMMQDQQDSFFDDQDSFFGDEGLIWQARYRDDHGQAWHWAVRGIGTVCPEAPTHYTVEVQRDETTIFHGLYLMADARTPLCETHPDRLDATVGRVGIATVLIPAQVGQALMQAIEMLHAFAGQGV